MIYMQGIWSCNWGAKVVVLLEGNESDMYRDNGQISLSFPCTVYSRRWHQHSFSDLWSDLLIFHVNMNYYQISIHKRYWEKTNGKFMWILKASAQELSYIKIISTKRRKQRFCSHILGLENAVAGKRKTKKSEDDDKERKKIFSVSKSLFPY